MISRRVSLAGRGQPRSVPLFGFALRALGTWREAFPRFVKSNPHGLVFPNRDGTPRNQRTPRFFHKQWSRWMRKAKLLASDRQAGLPVRWYDATRHTFATSMLNGLWTERWQIEDVSAALGHADITTTQRHYARILPVRLEELGRQAEASFRLPAKVAGRSPAPARDTDAAQNAIILTPSGAALRSGTRVSNPF